VDSLEAPEVREVARAREALVQRIAAAAGRVGRDPGGVRIVAVTKTVAPERIRAALAAGFDLLGENRVQEAAAKVGLIDGATWHLIGPLQSNKARRAVEVFAVIQSVDSLDLAQRLDRLTTELRPGRQLPVLLQVNVAADPTKAGYEPAAAARDLPEILDLPALRVDGLMTIGPLVAAPEAARPTFVALRALSDRLRSADDRLGAELSMGMTDDFEVAVEEGATLVRVGRAIFGDRPAG
jgi:pyridoxal phosphate enzyme (YggS family)